MNGGIVIDLGHDWHVRPELTRRPHRDLRGVLAVLVGLLSLLLLGVAEPDAAARTTVLRVQPGPLEASLSVTDDAVYVAKRGDPGSTVSAYALRTGDRRWDLRLDNSIDATSTTPDGTVLMAYAFGGGSAEPDTIAIDTATGRVLWQRESAIAARLIGSEIAIMVVESDTAPEALEALSTRTGALLWSTPVDPGLSFAVASEDTGRTGPERVVLGLADGTVHVLDAHSGTLLAEAAVVATDPQALAAEPSVEVDTAGDQVFARTQTPNGPKLTAYDFDLRQQWSVEDARVEFMIAGCGVLLCAMSEDAVAVLDPVTGSERWSAEGWATAEPIGTDWLVMSAREDNAQQVVADLRTGRVVDDLSGWVPLSLEPPLFGHTDTSAAYRTWLAVLDEATGRLRLVGTRDDVITRECRASDRYLVCPTLHGGVVVWRYDA